jgi:hypothetical protein
LRASNTHENNETIMSKNIGAGHHRSRVSRQRLELHSDFTGHEAENLASPVGLNEKTASDR